MLSHEDKEQIEFYKVLSIAINLDGEEKDAYLREQRRRLQQIMSEEQKKELEQLTKHT